MVCVYLPPSASKPPIGHFAPGPHWVTVAEKPILDPTFSVDFSNDHNFFENYYLELSFFAFDSSRRVIQNRIWIGRIRSEIGAKRNI